MIRNRLRYGSLWGQWATDTAPSSRNDRVAVRDGVTQAEMQEVGPGPRQTEKQGASSPNMSTSSQRRALAPVEYFVAQEAAKPSTGRRRCRTHSFSEETDAETYGLDELTVWRQEVIAKANAELDQNSTHKDFRGSLSGLRASDLESIPNIEHYVNELSGSTVGPTDLLLNGLEEGFRESVQLRDKSFTSTDTLGDDDKRTVSMDGEFLSPLSPTRRVRFISDPQVIDVIERLDSSGSRTGDGDVSL